MLVSSHLGITFETSIESVHQLGALHVWIVRLTIETNLVRKKAVRGGHGTTTIALSKEIMLAAKLVRVHFLSLFGNFTGDHATSATHREILASAQVERTTDEASLMPGSGPDFLLKTWMILPVRADDSSRSYWLGHLLLEFVGFAGG